MKLRVISEIMGPIMLTNPKGFGLSGGSLGDTEVRLPFSTFRGRSSGFHHNRSETILMRLRGMLNTGKIDNPDYSVVEAAKKALDHFLKLAANQYISSHNMNYINSLAFARKQLDELAPEDFYANPNRGLGAVISAMLQLVKTATMLRNSHWHDREDDPWWEEGNHEVNAVLFSLRSQLGL